MTTLKNVHKTKQKTPTDINKREIPFVTVVL